MVSASRISPTMMTSGSWRMALRRASPKLTVSVPSSRCETDDMASAKRNSIGSSMVIRCSGWLVVIHLMIAARVVDLPEPVGPVTSTRPIGSWQRSGTTRGRSSSSSDLTWKGTWRNTAAGLPRCMWKLPRNRATPLTP